MEYTVTLRKEVTLEKVVEEVEASNPQEAEARAKHWAETVADRDSWTTVEEYPPTAEVVENEPRNDEEEEEEENSSSDHDTGNVANLLDALARKY